MLVYAELTNSTYNPFTNTITCCPVGYAGCACEVQDVAAAPPYFIRTYHAPVQGVPSTFDIYIGATQLTEVVASQCPANNQYRVNYQEKGRGIIEFHANQAGCSACLCYYHEGSLISKETLNVRCNVFCATCCALCAYSTCHCGIYSCASCDIGVYGAAKCCGLYGNVSNNFGVYGNACSGCYGLYGIAICYGGWGFATCDCGLVGIACCNGGVIGQAGANCGGSFLANCIGVYSRALANYAVCACACNYGIASAVDCSYAGYFVAANNVGVYGAALCYAGCFVSNSCYGILASAVCFGGNLTASTCFGAYAQATTAYGLYACSATYGAFGYASTNYPVGGNGAYYNCVSSNHLKFNKESICILDCFKQYPEFRAKKWMYSDLNQKGFDCFISPMADEIKQVFNLTYESGGYYTLDGIALGASIELYHRLVNLEKEVELLKKGVA